MQRILRAAIVLACLCVPAIAAAAPPGWCVRVFVNEDDHYAPEAIGTGVLVDHEYVVTNVHVVVDRKDDKSIQVMFPDWTVARDAEVVKVMPLWDLALIKIKRTKREPIKFGDDPAIGDKCVMHGYGYGVYATGGGEVIGAADVDGLGSKEGELWDDILVLDGVGARSGDSGGAITKDGKLVGILNMTTGRQTVFIVQSQVRRLLRK